MGRGEAWTICKNSKNPTPTLCWFFPTEKFKRDHLKKSFGLFVFYQGISFANTVYINHYFISSFQ